MSAGQRATGRQHGGEPVSVADAREFFRLALAIVLADLIILGWLGRYPNGLSLSAAIIALVALVFIATQRRTADEVKVVPPSPETLAMLGVFTLFLAFYSVTGPLNPSPYNAHVRQAVGFLHGHTWIEAPNYIEHAQVGAYSYQLHPPLPAILLIPFAAIWGMGVNQTAFSVLFGALDVALAWRMLGRFPLTVDARSWLTAFLGAGTILWYEAVIGSSWAVSMVVAITFTLAVLDELFGAARPVRLGMFAGLAALARYDLAFDWPVYLVMEYRRRHDWRALLWMAPGFAAAAAISIALNWVRYHSWFDRGVFLFAPPGTKLFSVRYLAGNLYTLIFMAPDLNETFPYIHPRFLGQSLLLTSPAFILALRPSFKRPAAALLGIAALIAMTPSLFFFTNGFAQFGTRHYLHAFPLLLVLMAMGVKRRADQLTKILIVVSIILIGYGVWHISVYGLE